MPKAVKLKHDKQKQSVTAYIDSLAADQQIIAKQLLQIFTSATNAKPVLWGTNMIGFGEYDYTRSNGDYGTYFATGFAIRQTGPTIYIMPGYADYSHILKNLGPHKLGKACLYLKNLKDINVKVLGTLIKTGVKDLQKAHPVRMK
jgi:hypothetical protein